MADTKLTGLSELSIPSLEDLFYTVDDPGGTPISNKLTAARMLGEGGFLPGGILSLANGQPLYAPGVTLTPSATSTVNDTVDFAAVHGWLTGTAVTVSATAGGLTTFTTYYINATDTDTISFHTTVAAALAGTSKVDLTASITATITGIGIAGSTLYYLPFHHNLVRVFDGTRWLLKVFASISLALTLTNGKAYDVFLDDDATTLVLSTAWTSDILRADALGTQDGVTVLASDHTKLWLGTISATATDVVENHEWRRKVWNRYNAIPRRLFKDLGGSAAYNSSTIRQWEANTGAQIELVCGMPGYAGLIGVNAQLTPDATGGPRIGVGENSTTTFMPGSFFDITNSSAVSVTGVRGLGLMSITPRLGNSVYSFNQVSSTGTGSSTFASGRMLGVWQS